MFLTVKNPWVQSLIIIGAGLLLIFFIMTIRPYTGINNSITDRMFLPEQPSSQIVIAGIDDTTLETYGAWADWSRNLHASAIDNLKQAGALTIGMDILFSDASTHDDVLAESIRTAGNVILPVAGSDFRPSNDPVVRYNRILSPISPLNSASSYSGHANILPDTDGTVRHIPMVIQDTEGQEYPSFNLAVLQSFFAASVPDRLSIEDGTAHLFSRDIPLDTGYNFRIDFSTDNNKRPYLSYGDIISGVFNPALVENKIVLIGMTATGEHDKWMIPGSSEKVSGVLIHATVIDNILNQRFLTETGTFFNLTILLVLLCISGLLLPRVNLKWGLLVTAGLGTIFLAGSFISFENGYLVNILYPLVIPPFCFVNNIMIRNTSTLIDNARLKKEVESGYTGTIRALAASIEAKDHYTRGHSHRVTEYALMTAAVLGLSEDDMKMIEYAAILHDIGKIGVPDTILTKPDRLTDEERHMIEQHTLTGADIIEEVTFLNEVRKLVLSHHEKWDGTGYPEGLRHEEIPLGARIIAVADSYDSMTSNRAYRSAMQQEVAIEEIRNCIGTQFCPAAAEAFLTALADREMKGI